MIPSRDLQGKDGKGSVLVRFFHPSKKLEFLTDELKLHCFRSWMAGEPRTTPKGNSLPGVNKNSYWAATLEFHDKVTLKAQLNIALDRMSEARETVTDIVSSGGKTGIYLMFPGSSNIGISIDRYTLGRFVELGLELDIEVFPGS